MFYFPLCVFLPLDNVTISIKPKFMLLMAPQNHLAKVDLYLFRFILGCNIKLFITEHLGVYL